MIEKKILCMHGGLSPLLVSMDDFKNQQKPIRNPSKGIINDFLWSDPLHEILFWRTRQESRDQTYNATFSVRGSGFTFGEQAKSI